MSRVSPTLDAMLRRVHGRALYIKVVAEILHVVAIFLAALLLALAVDAWLALPPAGLIALDLLLFVIASLPGAVVFRIRRRNQYQAEAVALLIHEQLDLPSGRLINAVDFSLASPPGTSTALVESAIMRGEELASRIDPHMVVDMMAVRHPARVAGAAALTCLVSAVLLPGMFLAVGARLVHPLSDLPPFTRLSFSVAIQPVDIYVGQTAEIKVHVAGRKLPEEASVVFLGEQGRKTRIPMWREMADPLPGERQNGAPAEAVFSLKIENLAASFGCYIDTPGGRSAWQKVNILRNPLIEQVMLNYEYPAYTGWKPSLGTLGAGGICALRRSRVNVRCRSNVALGGGLLVLQPGKDSPSNTVRRVHLAPDRADARSVTGSFVMAWSGSFVLGITGADGLPGVKPVGGQLDCTPDKPPEVSIVEPEAVSVVPEGWKVRVRIEASDDVGIARLSLMRCVGSERYVPDVLPDDPDGRPASRTAVATMDLALMGATAGTKVRYFAIARDNEPEDGKTSETAVQTLLVISMAEYLDMARASYKMENLKEEWTQFLGKLDDLSRERDRVLERLAELEKKKAEHGGEAPSDRALMQALETELRDYEDALKETADAMRKRTEAIDLYDVEQVYKDMLRSLAGQLDGQAADARTVRHALAGLPENGAAPPDLAKAAARFRANKRPFGAQPAAEQLKGDMDKLDKAARLGFLADRMLSIIDHQRDLADRLSSANPPEGQKADRPRLEKLGAEQSGLEKELRETVNELDRVARECKDILPRMSASAIRLVNAAQKLAAWDDQLAAASACPDQPKEAFERSKEAAKKLESLLSDCKGNGGEIAEELDGCLSLTRKQEQATLKQMMQGMQMGMNLRTGMKRSVGGGSMGAIATVGLVGPRLPSNSKSLSSRRSGDGRDGPGQRKSSSMEKQSAAEYAIEADSTIENTTDARQIPGVPRAYRDLAEAYFRRLARDAVGMGKDLKSKPEEKK